MTEPDVLNRKIHELKEWQRVAWQRVADPLLTAFERREIRNHIRECDEELRQYLAMMSERLRFRARTVEDAGNNLAKLNFRLLA
jgi:F420-0:gamma-glutamyl ligase-like protein